MSRYFRDIAMRALGLAPMLTSTAFFVREDSDVDEETFDVMPETTERATGQVGELHTVHEHETRVESEHVNVQRTHSEELRHTETRHTHESEIVNREPGETVVHEATTLSEVHQKETLRELLREANRETVQRIHVQTERLERQSRETERLTERATERETRHTEHLERVVSHVRTEIGAAVQSPEEPAESTVNINIGRIEIRSAGSGSRPSPISASTPKRGISLEDYLRERSGGNR